MSTVQPDLVFITLSIWAHSRKHFKVIFIWIFTKDWRITQEWSTALHLFTCLFYRQSKVFVKQEPKLPCTYLHTRSRILPNDLTLSDCLLQQATLKFVSKWYRKSVSRSFTSEDHTSSSAVCRGWRSSRRITAPRAATRDVCWWLHMAPSSSNLPATLRPSGWPTKGKVGALTTLKARI